MRWITIAAVLVLAPGCMGGKSYIADGSFYSVRWDKNTWNQSAFTVERFDHKPSSTPHVRQFRWLHGERPVLPFPGEQCAAPPPPPKNHGLFHWRDKQRN